MTSLLGNGARTLNVAIVGAGPSGFYAAGSLFSQKLVNVRVDMFDRLPNPFGLVRNGVAPDHQKIKSVTKVYERTASDPRFRLFGHVNFGTDLTRDDLHQYYDAIIYAVGAQADRRLNIPGEDLTGSLSATEFVAWYNGHPGYVDLDIDLHTDNVVVVGVGNVAIDVARILAKTVDELKTTDIADHALETLAASQVKNIFILSRRGPAQVKFTNAEIKEFGDLADAEPVVAAAELELDPHSAQEIANDREAQRNLEILREYATRPLQGKKRQIHFRFLVSPKEILDDGSGHVGAVRIEHNELRATADGYLNAHGTGETFILPTGLVLRSVGYMGVALPEVPHDERTGIISNVDGRVVDRATGTPVMGEYVVGWAKRGPTGVIGTNKPDAAETVEMILADLPNLPTAPNSDPAAIETLLQSRGLNYVTIEGWRVLDRIETMRGSDTGRPRVKITSIEEMLQAIEEAARESIPG
ncbi:MAG: FAD-dependent oxidoreductase [Caldilineaceae bacterium]|nr:FAD-dependent oxidoreductase [Caldilineaceae bacterium]